MIKEEAKFSSSVIFVQDELQIAIENKLLSSSLVRNVFNAVGMTAVSLAELCREIGVWSDILTESKDGVTSIFEFTRRKEMQRFKDAVWGCDSLLHINITNNSGHWALWGGIERTLYRQDKEYAYSQNFEWNKGKGLFFGRQWLKTQGVDISEVTCEVE